MVIVSTRESEKFRHRANHAGMMTGQFRREYRPQARVASALHKLQWRLPLDLLRLLALRLDLVVQLPHHLVHAEHRL